MKRVIVYNDKNCEKCNSAFKPRSSTQQWCDKCLTKECLYCKKQFHVGKKTKYDTAKFCSRECLGKYNSQFRSGENSHAYKNGNRSLQKTKCCNCGKSILKEKQHLKKQTNSFCNSKCWGEFQKKHPIKGENHPKFSQITTICEWCEKEYKTWKCVKDKTRFCSKQCRHDWQSFMMKGENHPNWQGGKTGERSLDMISREYKTWRKSVFERDNYTCQYCGDNKGGNLNAHHIMPYKDFPKLRKVISNGITLCEKCHIDVHKNIIKLDIQSELHQ